MPSWSMWLNVVHAWLYISLWQRSYAFESLEVSSGESYFMKLNYPFKVSTFLHYASWTLHLVKNELVPSNWVVPTPCLELDEFLFWICSSVMAMCVFNPPCYLSTLMVLHEDSDACSLFLKNIWTWQYDYMQDPPLPTDSKGQKFVKLFGTHTR